VAADRVVVRHLPGDDAELAVEVLTEDELEIRPGIERSDAETENWLGFETPTEHSGPESTVEQSAMTLAEERSDEPERTDEEVEEPESAGRSPDEEEAARRALLASARGLAEALAEALRDAMAQEGAPAEDDSGVLPQRLPEVPAAEVIEDAGAPDAGQSASAHDTPGSESADSGPGVLTDKEAVAAALKAAPRVVPGRVVAAEGLEISTRRPQWSRTTLSTTHPRNPVVWITFGRDGRVRRAGFLRYGDQAFDTGYPSVDEPLINAVYRWTAKGKALDDLPRDKPDAGVTIRVWVVLVN
jgi:hypothetical protein